ncbi:preprotein translocase subunit SecG [Cerasicoccus maritimus]|uniref:preprotein translocase subunit SecG n=1 Tax=Cerasicoccus maritimus TaxID=490089 RepID=UPI002852D5B4|nr:preprotein translocase subunit SecG [Cerasicoccus maritimus]
MSAIIFGLLTLLLILVSGYLILIILMQRASSAGMGSAMGGGAAESALGAGAGNVLTKGTIIGAVAFFILCFGLYLGNLAVAEEGGPANTLPVEIAAPGTEPAQEETKPLVSLPQGMDWSATAQQNGEQTATTTVSTDQGTMIVTEDSIEVKPSEETAAQTEAAAEQVESTAADAKKAATEVTPATESTETKAQ